MGGSVSGADGKIPPLRVNPSPLWSANRMTSVVSAWQTWFVELRSEALVDDAMDTGETTHTVLTINDKYTPLEKV